MLLFVLPWSLALTPSEDKLYGALEDRYGRSMPISYDEATAFITTDEDGQYVKPEGTVTLSFNQNPIELRYIPSLTLAFGNGYLAGEDQSGNKAYGAFEGNQFILVLERGNSQPWEVAEKQILLGYFTTSPDGISSGNWKAYEFFTGAQVNGSLIILP